MTPAAKDVLVAGITDLIPLFTILCSMSIKHIGGMRHFVTHLVSTKGLAMADVTLRFLLKGHRSVFHRPTEVRMGLRDRPDDHRGLHQQIRAPADDGDGVAEVTLDADDLDLLPCLVDAYVLAVVATEAPGKRRVPLIVGIRLPVQPQLRETGVDVDPLKLGQGSLDIRAALGIDLRIAHAIKIHQSIDGVISFSRAGA